MATEQAPRTRAELAHTVALMKQHRVSDAFIAIELGISRSYVNDLLNDPDGSKGRARKERYRRPCPGYGGPCGKLMDGSNGRGPAAPKLCEDCAARKQHDERRWTREACLEAGRLWIKRAGAPPRAADFEPAMCRASEGARGVARREAQLKRMGGRGTYPPVGCVTREFGSWRKFRDALGEPVAAGGYVRTPEVLAQRDATFAARQGSRRERRVAASLATIRALAEEHGAIPTKTAYNAARDSAKTYGTESLRVYCGSWGAVLWRAVQDVSDED